MKVEEILGRLQEIIRDCEYRDPRNDNGRDPYICGYDSQNEISINIFFGEPKFNELSATFVIEYLGHSKMRKFVKSPTDKDYDCYFTILQDLVDSSNRFREQVHSFPKFTTEGNRNYQIDKIITNAL